MQIEPKPNRPRRFIDLRHAQWPAVLAALMVLGGGSAWAAQLPQYDIEAECHLEAVASDTPDAEFTDCMRNESRDREKAKRMSTHVSEKTMRYCDDHGNTGDGGSYSALLGCFVLEAGANAGPRKSPDQPMGSTAPTSKSIPGAD